MTASIDILTAEQEQLIRLAEAAADADRGLATAQRQESLAAASAGREALLTGAISERTRDNWSNRCAELALAERRADAAGLAWEQAR